MNSLVPIERTRTESIVLPRAKQVKQVPNYFLTFRRWIGEPLSGDVRATYRNKPLIDLDGERVFAEMAILRRLERGGWEGRWVDTFHGGRLWTHWPDVQEPLPPDIERLYDRLCRRNGLAMGRSKGSGSGCWDVLAWRGTDILFVESKGKDKIGPNQPRWLEVALEEGVPLSSFCVVTWSYR